MANKKKAYVNANLDAAVESGDDLSNDADAVKEMVAWFPASPFMHALLKEAIRALRLHDHETCFALMDDLGIKDTGSGLNELDSASGGYVVDLLKEVIQALPPSERAHFAMQ